jgi:hypothetical protein
MYVRRTLALVMLLMIRTIHLHAAAIDSTLFTTYSLETRPPGISWEVCGSTLQNSGCYGIGNLGPFGQVGAMIEGKPTQNVHNGTVARYIYVMDVAYQGNGVALYIYKKVDTITPSSDSVSVTLFNTVVLPLTGGGSAVAFMAANPKFLFVGTNQNGIAARVTKKNLTVTQLGAVSPELGAITADDYGYVTVTWGPSSSPSFQVFDPNGEQQLTGGGGSLMLDTIQAIQPSAVP